MSTSLLIDTSKDGTPVPEDGRLLSACQMPIWVGQKLFPDSPLYNMAFVFIFDTVLDEDRFECAFRSVLERSDALRSRVREVNGEPVVSYAPLNGPVLDVMDFSNEEEPEAVFREWARQKSQRVLPLDGPLWDSALVRLGEGRTGWYLNQHHLITDAYSFSLVYELVAEAYEDPKSLKTLPSL